MIWSPDRRPPEHATEEQRHRATGGDALERRGMQTEPPVFQPVETQPVEGAAILQRSSSGVLLVSGLPLDARGTFRQLRNQLKPFLDQHMPVLWLLETASMRDEVQARALGADLTLPRNSSPALVRSAADKLCDAAPGLRSRRTAIRHDILRNNEARLGRLLAAAGRNEAAAILAEASGLVRTASATPDIELWLDTMLAVHEPTHRHCLLMAGITAAFATSLRLGRKRGAELVRAALLHDIGKMLVSPEILDKPGQLAPGEMAILHGHPQAGFEMLQAQGGHEPTTLSVVRHHHEMLDGSGYPSALSGDRVDQAMRIATICDIFTALLEERAYKPGYPAFKALDTMRVLRNQLDQQLLAKLERLFRPM